MRRPPQFIAAIVVMLLGLPIFLFVCLLTIAFNIGFWLPATCAIALVVAMPLASTLPWSSKWRDDNEN